MTMKKNNAKEGKLTPAPPWPFSVSLEYIQYKVVIMTKKQISTKKESWHQRPRGYFPYNPNKDKVGYYDREINS